MLSRIILRWLQPLITTITKEQRPQLQLPFISEGQQRPFLLPLFIFESRPIQLPTISKEQWLLSQLPLSRPKCELVLLPPFVFGGQLLPLRLLAILSKVWQRPLPLLAVLYLQLLGDV